MPKKKKRIGHKPPKTDFGARIKKRKKKKRLTTHEQLVQMQHALGAIAQHVNSLNHTVAAMRRSMGIAGTYLAAEDARHNLKNSGIKKAD